MNTPHTSRKLSLLGALVLASTFATGTANAEVLPAVPSAPQTVSVVTSGTTAKVSWTAPKSAGASAVSGYTASTTPGDLSCVTTQMTCTITDLVPGQSYSITVRADSAAGVGELSDAVAVHTKYAFESLKGKNAAATAPASTFAAHAVVRVTAGNVQVGLQTPRAAKSSAQVIRYTVQLFDSSNSPVAKSANAARAGQPVVVRVPAGAGTYRVYVTAQRRNGTKATWQGPKITVG